MLTAQNAFRTVLVVDDEALIRMIAVETLEDAGYQVLEAANSEDAIEVLRGHAERVNVLMTDVHMPGEKNGVALVQYVEREYPKIRSIVVSGKAFREDVPASTVFVPKPYSYKALVDAIQHLCP
jgi:two-component system, response regulator PdtaR